MTYSPLDPALGGPLPPREGGDPMPRDMEPVDERDQDPVREAYEESLTDGSSRPLTDDEKEAARGDAGRQPRTFAPASERVAKAPAPGDDALIEEGERHAPSPGASGSTGDRSDPAELR